MFYGSISNGGGVAVAVERQKVDCGGSFFFLIPLISVFDSFRVTALCREMERVVLPWHAEGSLMSIFFESCLALCWQMLLIEGKNIFFCLFVFTTILKYE